MDEQQIFTADTGHGVYLTGHGVQVLKEIAGIGALDVKIVGDRVILYTTPCLNPEAGIVGDDIELVEFNLYGLAGYSLENFVEDEELSGLARHFRRLADLVDERLSSLDGENMDRFFAADREVQVIRTGTVILDDDFFMENTGLEENGN